MEPEAEPQPRLHLNFLDGIRGLSALYVVMYHIYHELTGYQHSHLGPSRLIFAMEKLFGWGGHDCVTVFICLSGFSLAIPLAKASYQNLANRVEMKNYFIRRFLRIAPPYFVAIALIVGLALVFPGLSVPTQTPWNNALPILDARSILFHLTFIQALDPSQVFKISPQFWSIGTEAQLYLWLPLVIVPLAVKRSISWAMGAALLACLVVVQIKNFESACLHYVLTFTAGALAAHQVFSKPKGRERWKLPQIALGVGLFVGALTVAFLRHNSWAVRDIALTPMLGFGLYWLAKDNNPSGIVQAIRAFLGCRPVAFLGRISYSLYLVHYVLLALVHATLVSRGVSVHLTVLVLILGVPFFSVLVAWIMQLLVESPSMNYAKRFRESNMRSEYAKGPIGT
ncbi:MAG: acyltransferase [Armatimonadota bacterium]